MRTSWEKVAKEEMSSEMEERGFTFRITKTWLWHRIREHDLNFGTTLVVMGRSPSNN